VLRYVVGDATLPGGDGPKVIVHVCNDIGGWGAGFVLAVSRRWRAPEQEFRGWFERRAAAADPPFALGQVQFVAVADDLWVANLIGQRDIRARNGVPPVRYDAIEEGLRRVAAFAAEHAASVHMPRIGAGLAGGDWHEIEAIITRALPDTSVTVYDLPTKAPPP
jgi:O-acetyl-ADP-ribose deacetylase (regulator of RNase III)